MSWCDELQNSASILPIADRPKFRLFLRNPNPPFGSNQQLWSILSYRRPEPTPPSLTSARRCTEFAGGSKSAPSAYTVCMRVSSQETYEENKRNLKKTGFNDPGKTLLFFICWVGEKVSWNILFFVQASSRRKKMKNEEPMKKWTQSKITRPRAIKKGKKNGSTA